MIVCGHLPGRCLMKTCMLVCMYVYIYIYMYVCVYGYMYIHKCDLHESCWCLQTAHRGLSAQKVFDLLQLG